MFPSRPPDEARRNDRYVLENDEHVDVLVARAVSTVDGVLVAFDEVWKRRSHFLLDDVEVPIPAAEDQRLIEDRRLTAEEFDARVHAPWTEYEREQFDELVRWFQRRYPTPRDRLAATRRLAASWYRRDDGRG